jgi:hypothetical protein
VTNNRESWGVVDKSCTCSGPAAPAHDPDCPVRIAHPRVDLGDMDDRFCVMLYRCGVGVQPMPGGPMMKAMREAFMLGRDWGKKP